MQPANQECQSLRLLIVEDSEDDAQLLLHTLRRGGFLISAERVETAQALQAALGAGEWDLVISDHNLPQFSAPEALRLVQEHVRHIPFIIVSGSMGEDLAVAAMKAGASDYLVKGHLNRLVPAVRRELADAEQRRRRSQAEEALRQTETQLRQAQKMEAVGRLAGGIAHDFNNLLTAILGYSELSLQHVPDHAPLQADIREIKKAGERAAALTRQLLAFSRQQILEPRVADFNEIVTNVEKLLRRVIGADVELVTVLDSGIGRVRVDPGQMEQVLMNLAVNARDAMPDGGRLTILTGSRVATVPEDSLAEARRHVVVTVRDSGVGMPPDVLKQVFEPFFTTKAPGHGTGLGLSTVYGIVKQSGGQILVDSQPGCGTTFEMYLPCVDQPLEAARPASRTSMRVEGSETILLVDDDDGTRELLSRAMRSAGYNVLTATDGQDALATAEAHARPIHMLVTDLVMPRLGGAQVAAELSRVQSSLVVLYISGHTDRDATPDVSRTSRAYLQKPFTPSALLHKVRELLDGAAAS